MRSSVRDDAARMRGYLSTLKSLRRRGRLYDECLFCAAAARNGAQEALKALRRAENSRGTGRAARRARRRARAMEGARAPWRRRAATSSREQLPVGLADVRMRGEEAHRRGAEVGARERLPVGLAAAEGGHLEVLKWARENDWRFWDWGTGAWAAVVRPHCRCPLARENDCPWDWRTCAHAAKGGHLEVLKWLRANDCPGTVNPGGFTLPFGFTFGHAFGFSFNPKPSWVYRKGLAV